jgi:hypothetical protein
MEDASNAMLVMFVMVKQYTEQTATADRFLVKLAHRFVFFS